MGRMVVLKPVVWNDNGYLGPATQGTHAGYVGEHGYGHEEWNGRPDWTWNGSKVFHTEGKGRLLDYAARGELGMIMTAMKGGRFYAVGVGCAVSENSEAERKEIAKHLQLRKNGAALWKLPHVRALKPTKAAFNTHWRGAHTWVRWRCPADHYRWFARPIEIIPNDVIPARPPRRAIIKMHGSYQAIRPDQAISILSPALRRSDPVMRWLSGGDFDPVTNRATRKAPAPRKGSSRSAATATEPYVRYLKKYEIEVTPRHHRLQSDFETYILEKRLAKGVIPNVAGVDVRYTDPVLGTVLAEIKPADPQTARFAIRTAMGQLFDYRQLVGGNPRLLIVIGSRPASRHDEALALDNGFGLAWPSGRGFKIRWPVAA
jgi:hypothetical protein